MDGNNFYCSDHQGKLLTWRTIKANSSNSNPRRNLKAKTSATSREHASLQMQRWHTSTLPKFSPCLLPVHKQSKNEVTSLTVCWAIRTLRIDQRASWNSCCMLLHMQKTGRMKAWAWLQKKNNSWFYRQKAHWIPSSTVATSGRTRFPQGALCWPESQQMKQPAGISSLCCYKNVSLD